MDLVEAGARERRAASRNPRATDWLEGTGMALAMLECGPPTEHRSGAVMRLLADGRYHLAVGSTEMGNGSVTSHRQIAAGVLGCARRRRSTSSTPIPTRRRTTPAPSPAPARWSPERPWH